jgi:hypothetical protein
MSEALKIAALSYTKDVSTMSCLCGLDRVVLISGKHEFSNKSIIMSRSVRLAQFVAQESEPE